MQKKPDTFVVLPLNLDLPSQEGGAESGVLAKQCRAAPWGPGGSLQHEIEGDTPGKRNMETSKSWCFGVVVSPYPEIFSDFMLVSGVYAKNYMEHGIKWKIAERLIEEEWTPNVFTSKMEIRWDAFADIRKFAAWSYSINSDGSDVLPNSGHPLVSWITELLKIWLLGVICTWLAMAMVTVTIQARRSDTKALSAEVAAWLSVWQQESELHLRLHKWRFMRFHEAVVY